MQIVTTASTASAMAPPIIANESSSPKDSEKLDLTKGALEMKLVMLSVELSGIIDKVLKGRMQSQKGRNGEIDDYNELLNALRKLQKSSEAFSADSLNKAYIDVPPNSEVNRRNAARIRDRGIATAKDADERGCLYIEDWERHGAAHSTFFCRDYDRMTAKYVVDSVSTGFYGGTLVYACHRKDNGQAANISIRTYDYFTIHDPKWPSEEAERNYHKLQNTLTRLNKEYEVNAASGKVSLGEMLHDYGIYKENEKLPATKEELEAATEKISAIIGAIESTQDLKMTDIQKFTNARNEAYDLAVSVNNAKVESLKTLIAMIGES